MSRPSRLVGTLAAALAAVAAPGCWEQMDGGEWFPQMKRQIAIQAYEEVEHRGQVEGFLPPSGTVPVGASDTPDLASMKTAEQDKLQNPVPASLESLKNGELMFQRYCATCHGPKGGGDGPVAGPPFGEGPFGLVLPIGGPRSVARAFSDGHIYATISIGRGRMPSYQRIPEAARWDIVNYIREINAGDRK